MNFVFAVVNPVTVPNVIFSGFSLLFALVIFPATSYISAYTLYVPLVKLSYVLLFVTAVVSPDCTLCKSL